MVEAVKAVTSWLTEALAPALSAAVAAVAHSFSRWRFNLDHMAFDHRPDACWRCDSAAGEGDLGLCGPCADELRAEPSK